MTIINKPWLPDLKPADSIIVGPRPAWSPNWAIDVGWYKANIAELLMESVEAEFAHTGNQADYDKGRAGAVKLADAYVAAVAARAGEGRGSWPQSVKYALGLGSSPSCEAYVRGILTQLEDAAGTSGWRVKPHFNVTKFGQANHLYLPNERFDLTALHSFISLSYRTSSAQLAGDAAERPDWIVDPWSTNRPDLYDYGTFQSFWPIPEAP